MMRDVHPTRCGVAFVTHSLLRLTRQPFTYNYCASLVSSPPALFQSLDPKNASRLSVSNPWLFKCYPMSPSFVSSLWGILLLLKKPLPWDALLPAGCQAMAGLLLHCCHGSVVPERKRPVSSLKLHWNGDELFLVTAPLEGRDCCHFCTLFFWGRVLGGCYSVLWSALSITIS